MKGEDMTKWINGVVVALALLMFGGYAFAKPPEESRGACVRWVVTELTADTPQYRLGAIQFYCVEGNRWP